MATRKRWIIHVDMDAFFAAVEQRDNPELKGRPVIIGGLSGRGVVSTASYEARRFGVRSAMPMVEARRRCPQGIFLPGDHGKYRAVSRELRQIFARYSPLVEPLSLDEAFLDVTGMEELYPAPPTIARLIKAEIRNQLQLTASAGVAPNKFLAKLASDLQKPDGLVVIEHGQEQAAIRNIPVSRLWGVGEVTARTLAGLGLNTIGQVASANTDVLVKHCGQIGRVLVQLANGIDDRPVVADYTPQSIGRENTFEQDLTDHQEIQEELLSLAEQVGWRLRRQGFAGRTITVKIRFGSFRTLTRQRTLNDPTNLDDVLYRTAKEILATVDLPEGIRLLGITASHLTAEGGQMALFAPETEKQLAVCTVMDQLKARFGEGAVARGRIPGRRGGPAGEKR